VSSYVANLARAEHSVADLIDFMRKKDIPNRLEGGV